MSQLKRHEKKRMKRVVKELTYWRSKSISSLKSVNTRRFSEDYAVKMREGVKATKKTIKHIDYLIEVACVMLKIDLPRLEDVPRVRVRKHVPYVPPKTKPGEATFDFTVGP